MQASDAAASITGLWRFPVKSMLGEELDAVDVTEAGIVGDRAFALIDNETGKVVSAKHPKQWPELLRCRAAGSARPCLRRVFAAAVRDQRDNRPLPYPGTAEAGVHCGQLTP